MRRRKAKVCIYAEEQGSTLARLDHGLHLAGLQHRSILSYFLPRMRCARVPIVPEVYKQPYPFFGGLTPGNGRRKHMQFLFQVMQCDVIRLCLCRSS